MHILTVVGHLKNRLFEKQRHTHSDNHLLSIGQHDTVMGRTDGNVRNGDLYDNDNLLFGAFGYSSNTSLEGIKERFKEMNRVYLITFMTFVLTTSFFYPNGLINYGFFESESMLIAQREGAANCMTTLKLDIDNKFIERNVCFGVTVTKGDFRIISDTIYFENVTYGRHENEFYEFAIIKNDMTNGKYLGDLVRYRNHSDTIGTPLWITKNEFKK